MRIVLDNIGRRFNKEWIFRGVNTEFLAGNAYAILGSNGTGKSTFLKVLSGSLTPSEGKIAFLKDNKEIPIDQVFKEVSMAAPYIDLIEEYTLIEALEFHFCFKPISENLKVQDIPELMGLEKHRNKLLKNFSSGMKQRVKLVMALLAETSILLIDEPTINLDEDGIRWYKDLIKNYSGNKLILIGSNQALEYENCDQFIHIEEYKTGKG